MLTEADYLDENFELKKNRHILVNNGVIESISDSDNFSKNLQRIDTSGHYILPGLINLHTHCGMNFLKGYHQNVQDVVSDVFFKTEKQLTQESIESFSYSYLYDGIRSGVTSYLDHYFHSQGTQKAMTRLGVRGFCGETIIENDGPFPFQASIDKNLINPISSPLIEYVLCPHASDTVTEESWNLLVKLAKTTKSKMHFHLAQRSSEKEYILKNKNKSPVEYLNDVGALSDSSIAVHLIHISNSDIELLKKSKTHMVLCPSSQVLFEKISPLIEHLETIDQISIATDCAASNDSCDLLAELRHTASLYRQMTGKFINPKTLLKTITLNPAKALGADDKLGSLEKNKYADMVFVRKTPHFLPEERFIEHLIYSNNSKDIDHVIVAGNAVLWNQGTVNINKNEISQKFKEAYKTIEY